MKSLLKKNIKVIKVFFEYLLKIKNFFKFQILPRPEKEKENLDDCYDLFEKDEIQDSYDKFKPYFYSSLFISSKKINEFALKRSIKNLNLNNDLKTPYFFEFGVFDGTSINKFAEILKDKKIYGFDSFLGMREDWSGTDVEQGFFNLNGKLPKTKKNVELVKGWVQDTVHNFLEEHDPHICFAHMDLDTYESTKFVLEEIKPYLKKGSILLFNEFYNFPGWSVGEYKALNETFDEKEYKIVAFSKHGWEVVVEIN
mgnify:FL=1